MDRRTDFTPRMDARTRALRTLAPLSYRRFAGGIADVWRVRGEVGGGGFYVSPDPRIVIYLDQTPPTTAIRTAQNGQEQRGLQGFYIPAGVPLWSRMEVGQDFTHLDFHLDANNLHRRLADAGVHADLTQPRMLHSNSALLTLAQLAADEVRSPRHGDMMLDGLLAATLGQIFTAKAQEPASSGGLTAHQFNAVERHLRQHLNRHITVAEMADIAGISESWFAHCFRRYRGETPLRWQARLRLEAARDMITSPDISLADVAHAAGFADQAHLSRAFSKAYGQPPSAWRRLLFQQS
ncbi:AraC family transcriptional regulator [Ketogulonicigenium vulgare]|uniref:Putative transcriptional regulator n=1 Tax=Ketogulonicigenium vulgare (strain WSH-001) TaxID=759362 RepID=F9YBA2_KETVW|nr:AraC family transcriptional regulator [Ketogulonicigenium vulgare]ADO44130.1 helix-turn-helix domain-containing protein [Ketogulonicigenium vulgare Y25]AEM42654.1 putative transcriptional regulator [Ketogulonicigenium vulgare WSH-001]ALJ82459.1 AraC family transcriptional regulator [Ketogulonicigenium vulgare]ANW35245.1 AraC family transcriptional regulator [Ketogulonicigenium vulgare]AOZ53356.1 helix-turn-helix domain-containing protein [Ketogulonicigenium vulgare]